MSEEPIVAIPATTEQESTVVPEPEVTTPEEPPVEVPLKTFTQEEVDTIVGKRLAREQRRLERAAVSETVKPSIPVPVPTSDQFATTEAYVEALATRKAEELLQKREQEKQRTTVIEDHKDRELDALEKYPDYKQVVGNDSLPITNVMAESIFDSSIGPDIAYYLGTNISEAKRISQLSPLTQAKEIGKIELKLLNDPVVKKTTTAPAPIKPVSPTGSGSATYDTTDSRSMKTMTDSEWIAAERLRQIKKLEARKV